MTIKTWNIEAMTGYKPMSTFYEDFSIADRFGTSAVRSTFNRAFREWKTDYKMVTELTMALNWKCWEHEGSALCDLYIDLYYKAADWCRDHLKGEELSYYYRTTD